VLPELDVEWFLINILLINNYKVIRSSKILANQIKKKELDSMVSGTYLRYASLVK